MVELIEIVLLVVYVNFAAVLRLHALPVVDDPLPPARLHTVENVALRNPEALELDLEVVVPSPVLTRDDISQELFHQFGVIDPRLFDALVDDRHVEPVDEFPHAGFEVLRGLQMSGCLEVLKLEGP